MSAQDFYQSYHLLQGLAFGQAAPCSFEQGAPDLLECRFADLTPESLRKEPRVEKIHVELCALQVFGLQNFTDSAEAVL